MTASEVFRRLLELFAIWALYWITVRHPDVTKDVAIFWKRSRLTIGAVAGFFTVASLVQVFTFGQYDYPQRTEFFPFTRWAMFSGLRANIDSVQVYEFEGITATGESKFLNPAKLFPTSNAVVHFTKTHRLGDALSAGSVEARERAARLMRSYMSGLKKRYEAENGGERLQTIRLWRKHVSLEEGAKIPPSFTRPDSTVTFDVAY